MEAVDNISSNDELLLEYVRNNEVEKIRELVKSNQKLFKYKYGKPFEGMTIIHIVCSTLSHEVEEETVQTLIDLGADLCEYDGIWGNQPIYLAALSLNANLLRNICVQLGQEKIDSTTKYGKNTALLLIIRSRDCESSNTLECIRVLLDHKADVNIVNDASQSPIWLAALKGYKRVVGLLLSINPQIDIDRRPIRESKTARDLIMENNLYDKKKLPPKKTIFSSFQPCWRSSEEDSLLELEEFGEQHESDCLIDMEQSDLEPEQLLLEYVRRNDVEKIRKLVEGNQELLKYKYGVPFLSKTIIHIVCSTLAEEVRKKTVETLIELGADLCEYIDHIGYWFVCHNGYQAIHLAALSLNANLLKNICAHLEQEEIDSTTKKGHYTALSMIIAMCDCESRNALECIRVLLDHKADVNKVNSRNESSIWCAAYRGYKRVVGLLFSRCPGIDIDNCPKGMFVMARDQIIENNLYDKDKLPPITNERYLLLEEMFETLLEGREDDFLKLENIKSFVEAKFEGKKILQICLELNLPKSARRLVELGARVYEYDLEIAAKNGYFEMFMVLSVKLDKIPKFLLKFKDEPQTVKSILNKCLRLLLWRKKSLVNEVDEDGLTPLYLACICGADEDVINILLSYGAYLSNTDKYGNLAIDGIETEILRKLFNNCITYNSNDDIDDEELKVIFNYQTLVPGNNSDDGMIPTIRHNEYSDTDSDTHWSSDSDDEKNGTELSLISHIAGSSKLQSLLKHSLITSFIQMKWNRISFVFYANLLLYLTAWFCLAFYTLNIYNNKTDCEEKPSGYRIPLLVIIWTTFISFIVKEFFQMVVSPLMYFKQMENYLEMTFIIFMALILSWPEPNGNTRKQLSAFTILTSSFQLIFLLGQLPMMSSYIIMLRTVSWSFLKLLLWNAILIIAFGLSFYTLFADNTTASEMQSFDNLISTNEEQNSFDSIGVSIFKTIVMMTGEFDANNINFDTIPISWFIFVFFIFMIVIVLSNLMSGLAVSDTQEIKSNAKLLALKSRVDHICYIENMLLGNMALLPSKLLQLYKISHLNFKMLFSKKFTGRAYLFPNYLKPFEMTVFLNKKGKIELPEKKNNKLPQKTRYAWVNNILKIVREITDVRLDRETLKNVRLLLKERKSIKAEDSIQDNLGSVNDATQQKFGTAVDTLQKRLDSVDESMQVHLGTAVYTLQKRLDSVDESIKEKLEVVNESMQQKLATVDDTIQNLKTVVDSLQKRQEATENQQKQILKNLDAISENMNKLLDKLN